MISFLARRVALFVAALIVMAALIFVMLRVPAGVRGDNDGGFLGWFGGALIGNFGLSASGAPVGPMVAGALGVTLPLVLLALVLSVALGGGAAWLAIRRRGTWIDRALSVLVALGVALPSFWLGLLLALVFSLGLHLFPTGGFVPWGQNIFGAIGSLILPATALALPKAAALAQRVRAALIAVTGSDYIEAARLHGLTELEALRRHGLRNGLLALLRPLGIEVSTLIAAALVVESAFYLPGLGQLIFNGIASGDAMVARAGLLVAVEITTLLTLALRVGEGWIDPRSFAEDAR